MKAKLQEFYDTNRQQLHEIVPLDAPLTVFIEASSACDLRCKFCTMASPAALESMGHIMKNMNQETFSLVVEQLKEFSRPFKRIYFVGFGEVLLNPRLPEMVKIIKESNVTAEVVIFTNGVNLTHEMSLGLIRAGLDAITISVNGLGSDDYERNCGRKIDFDKYLEQIAFLYANKSNLLISIKIVDQCVKTDSDKQLFFNTFGNICDYINIERIASFHKDGDYSSENIKESEHLSKFYSINAVRRVCSRPFMSMIISSLGKVNFCDAIYGFPFEDLDIRKQNLTNIWNGSTHKQFLLNQLKNIDEGITSMCKDCNGRSCLAFEQDNLDPHADKILEKLKAI